MPPEEALREAHDRLRQRFGLLAQLLRRTTATLDPTEVLQHVVSAACELTGAKYGALGVFEESARIRQFVTHGLTAAERERIGALPQGRGLLGHLQQVQRPVRVTEISQHPLSVGFPPGHPPMHSFLGVPVRLEGEPIANIYLTEKAGGGPFTEEDEELLVVLADQAALAIRNARLHEVAERERERLRSLVDTSPTGVIVVDGRTRQVVLANREASRLVAGEFQPGITLDEFISNITVTRPDGGAYPPEERPLGRALERGERTLAQEQRLVGRDGTAVPALVNATPVYGPDGKVSGAIIALQDITPLEELERLRNEFLGMVSHELRTPLTAIKGSAAMALGTRKTLAPAEATELFQIIDEQADRLRDMVDNLLDITRIEAGTLSVTTEATSLRKVLEGALVAFARTSGGRETRITGVEDGTLVMADAHRIEQVLANLLSNAAKFSPAIAPIEVRASHGANEATVSVRDHGRGLSTQALSRLFRKFSQVPDERGVSAAGAGLGLAICKGIVEAHGGRIWAESAGPGTGATFTFTLPLAPAAVPPEAGAGTRVSVADRAAHMGRVGRAGERTKVLVVDDEPQVVRIVRRTLEEAGFAAVGASTPEEAIKATELEEPDLLLLDLRLQGTSGYDVLKRIREFSGVPVIFLTGETQTEEAVRALRAGADDYVTKPFSPTELIARIGAALRRRVLPDQVEVRPPFRLDGLEVDFAERRVSVDGKPVRLSATEYKLLYELATNAGRVLTHDQLLRNVWGPEYSGEHELVRSFVRNLRKKLGDDARHPRFVQTEPQVGYRVLRPGA